MVDACSADCGSLCRMDKWSGVGMRRLSWPKVAPCAVALALLLAVPAHSSGDAISGYVDEHGGEVCAFISDQPNLAGVKHAVDHILATSGLPEDQTGQLLAGSVRTNCPEYGELVEEFVWYVHRRQQQNGGVLGS